MKWLEIIELRSGSHSRQDIKHVLNVIMDELTDGPDMPVVNIYENHAVTSDFSIHLQHKGSKPDSVGSVMGMSIAASLRAHGLVNHQIWCEVKYNENSVKEES